MKAQLLQQSEELQKAQNEANQSETSIKNLKRRIAEMKKQRENDFNERKVLELRVDRNIPYVRLEQRNFKVDKIPHE